MDDDDEAFRPDDETFRLEADDTEHTRRRMAGSPRAGAGGGEGVRILGEDEVEAAEHDPALARRLDAADLAPAGLPPDDDRPVLRFPIADDEDLTSLSPMPLSPMPLPTGEPADDLGDEPESFSSWSDSAATDETISIDGDPLDEGLDAPTSVLPHWTEPPSGEVRIFDDGTMEAISDAGGDPWATFTVAPPRWRDGHDDWDDSHLTDLANMADDDIRVGAMDPARQTGVHPIAFTDDPIDDDGEIAPPVAAADPPPMARPKPLLPPSRAAQPDAGHGLEQGPGRDLPMAVGVGVLLAVVAIALMKAGPFWTMLLITPVVVGCAVEYFEAIHKAGFHPQTLLGLAATTGLVLGAYQYGGAVYPAVLVAVVLFGMLWNLFGLGGERPLANLAVTLLGVLWIGFMGSFAALMVAIPVPGATGILFGTIVATAATDIGAYFVGRSMGHSKMAPAVSPNKTWEGFAGGILSSIVASVIVLHFITGINPFGHSIMTAVKLGLVAGVVGPLGDLCQSMVKRELGIKDMGTVLPGHGGLLDRFDALLFVLPTAFYLLGLL